MVCLGIKHFEIMHASECTHTDLSLGIDFGCHNSYSGLNKSFLFGQFMATTSVARYICNGLCEQ